MKQGTACIGTWGLTRACLSLEPWSHNVLAVPADSKSPDSASLGLQECRSTMVQEDQYPPSAARIIQHYFEILIKALSLSVTSEVRDDAISFYGYIVIVLGEYFLLQVIFLI